MRRRRAVDPRKRKCADCGEAFHAFDSRKKVMNSSGKDTGYRRCFICDMERKSVSSK